MTPQVSLILCMPSMGAPISAVLIPALAAIIGPMVEPQAESFLTMKSYIGTPQRAATSLTIVALTVSVVYL
jgi:hypothetical protein